MKVKDKDEMRSKRGKQKRRSELEERNNLELFGRMIQEAIRNPDLTPDRLSVISLSEESRHRILTPKRLEILRILRERGERIESITDLAKEANRSLESVSRDLKILRNYGFVELSRNGKAKRPLLVKEIILIPID